MNEATADRRSHCIPAISTERTMLEDHHQQQHCRHYHIVMVSDRGSRRQATVRGHNSSSSSSSDHKLPNMLSVIFTLFITVIAMISQSTVDAKTLKNSIEHKQSKYLGYRIFYQAQKSEKSLPLCTRWSVCNKVDTYEEPWLEKQCRCPGQKQCSMSFEPSDGHTITDKSRHYKLCEPTRTLRKCRYFRDVTWTMMVYADKTRQQIMHCRCPKTSVAYILKTHSYSTPDGVTTQFSYACSPQTRLKCKWKEPCRLFTVKKRSTVDSANYDTLCQCSAGYKCPKKHTDRGVIFDMLYSRGDSTRMYSGYCIKS